VSDDDLDGVEESDFEADVLSREDIRRYIVAGLNVGDLAAAFRVSRFVMMGAIALLQPCGQRNRSPLYAIADVAPRLVKPTVEVESYIKGLKPKDLPPSLQKAFWDAQEARQSYEEKAGNLWHTHRVQSVIGNLVMIVRQRLVLATDQIDRMTPLTAEQRKLVQGSFDQVLSDLQKAVSEAFKDYSGVGDRQELFEKGPPQLVQVQPIDSDGLDV
jgi:hypothetical protein